MSADKLYALAMIERLRQIEKGHDEAHDDGHSGEQLAMAAASYALPWWARANTGAERLTYGHRVRPGEWPFEPEAFKPTPEDRKRELVLAAAFLMAEWERIERAEKT